MIVYFIRVGGDPVTLFIILSFLFVILCLATVVICGGYFWFTYINLPVAGPSSVTHPVPGPLPAADPNLLDGAEGGTVGYTWLLGFSLFFLFTF
jgi:hypothetical protein